MPKTYTKIPIIIFESREKQFIFKTKQTFQLSLYCLSVCHQSVSQEPL